MPEMMVPIFRVADAARTAQWYARLGFEVVGMDEGNPEWKEAFIHPRSANGVLIQLAEFPHTGS